MADKQPRYQDLPSLSSFDYGKLKESIAEHGVLEPVIVDENDHTLDGHHRLRACAELGVECPKRVLSGLSESEKRAYAFMVNVARRQMSVQERRAMWRRHRDEAAAKLRANPAKSNRQVAEEVGTTKDTVAKTRAQLETSGEIAVHRAIGGHAPGGAGNREGVAVLERPAIADPDTREIANHKALMSFEVTLYFPVPSDEIRSRNGLPYPRESERMAWQSGELYLTTGAWRDRSQAHLGVVALAERLFRELRSRPLPTMR